MRKDQPQQTYKNFSLLFAERTYFINKVHYNVSGLQSTHIKTQAKNALDKIDGVQMVNVDLVSGSIEVGFNESTDKNQIKQCIEHTGCLVE